MIYKKINMAIFFGGKSAEHEVSIESIKNTIKIALSHSDIVNVYPIYITKDGKWYYVDKNIKKIKKISNVRYDFTSGKFIINKKTVDIHFCFSMIHGTGGEDGKLQGFFETINVPYAGSDVLASAISMNKRLSKRIVKMVGVNVLDDVCFTKDEFEKERDKIINKIKKLGFPVFVKPVSLGSSVGVSKVKSERSLLEAIKKAFDYDIEIMVEKGVDKAREIVCGVIGGYEEIYTSICGEVVVKGKHEFYDYNAKYLDPEGMELKIPALISDEECKKVQQYSKKIFKAIGCYGFARVDFLMDPKTNEIFFCEINTIPGFTSHSLFPSLFEKSLVELDDQIRYIMVLGFLRYFKNNKIERFSLPFELSLYRK